MIKTTAFICLLCLLLLPALAYGKTIYVPDDHALIQDAINAAQDMDIIIVRDGTYPENIDFLGKAVVVTSENGPVFTTIDGNSTGSVVTFSSGEGPGSVLEGFTLTNGIGTVGTTPNDYYGGGIFCENSSPSIRGNLISENVVIGYYGGRGGGIFCSASSPSITGNTISANRISGGVSPGLGGGICCYDGSSPMIEENVISRNMATDGWAFGGGGGIYCDTSCSPEIRGNIIADNTTNGDGGGIYLYESGASLRNNMIAANTGYQQGGGICCNDSLPVLVNNTIVGNESFYLGGGVAIVDRSSSTVIVNTILWDNTAPGGPEISIDSKSSVTINHSDVKGGQASIQVEAGGTLDWGEGMIDADPLFVNAAEKDFHLTFDSPCRSTGDRNAPGLPDEDFEGDPRTGLFVFPDMGADEFHTHFYINGAITAGSTATGVIIGWPQTNPVVLISGSGVLLDPPPTPYGDFWLMPPWEHRIHFDPMPDNGVRTIERTVATSLPPGTRIPMQALVGTELSNLWIAVVE